MPHSLGSFPSRWQWLEGHPGGIPSGQAKFHPYTTPLPHHHLSIPVTPPLLGPKQELAERAAKWNSTVQVNRTVLPQWEVHELENLRE